MAALNPEKYLCPSLERGGGSLRSTRPVFLTLLEVLLNLLCLLLPLLGIVSQSSPIARLCALGGSSALLSFKKCGLPVRK